MYQSHKQKRNNVGFTLVELSIIIIIIGLLIAGVAAGANLIKQAQLNSIIIESRTYMTALGVFKSRYNYYPGDFPYATNYWPTAPSVANGNGNGLIEFSESPYVWADLTAASIISLSTDPNDSVEPYAKFGNSTIWRVESNGCPIYSISGNTKNSLEILRDDSSDFFIAIDVYTIDKKVDDGKPADGAVYGVNQHGTLAVVQTDGATPARGDCVNNYNSTEAKYNLYYTSPGISRIYFYLPS